MIPQTKEKIKLILLFIISFTLLCVSVYYYIKYQHAIDDENKQNPNTSTAELEWTRNMWGGSITIFSVCCMCLAGVYLYKRKQNNSSKENIVSVESAKFGAFGDGLFDEQRRYCTDVTKTFSDNGGEFKKSAYQGCVNNSAVSRSKQFVKSLVETNSPRVNWGNNPEQTKIAIQQVE